MRTKVALTMLTTLLIAGATMPLAQAAFHGAKWEADGVAAGAAGAYLITVKWNGGFWCGGNTFTVTLTDAVTSQVTTRTFRGNLAFNGPAPFFGWEWLIVNGQSTDPAVAFTVSGWQSAFVNPPPSPHTLTQVLVGQYQGLTWTATTVNEFWSFC